MIKRSFMRRTVLSLALLFVSVSAFADYKAMISFSGYSQPELLSNFPVLVVFRTDQPASFLYSNVASTNGWDLRFYNSNETAELKYEIESWATNADSHVWVQVPMLSSSNDHIWAYWGNSNLAAAPAVYTTNGATWSEGFVGVWHLAAAGWKDSGPYGHIGGTSGTVNRVSGVVNGAADFSGTKSCVSVANSSSLQLTTAGTLEGWLYMHSYHRRSPTQGGDGIIHKGNQVDFSDESYSLQTWNVGHNAALAIVYDDYEWLMLVGNSGLALNSWTHIAGSWTPTTAQIYKDGKNDGSSSHAYLLPRVTPGRLVLADQNDSVMDYGFDGVLDELRVSSVKRSANWVWATWMTMASNTAFARYGAETQLGSGVDRYGVPDSWKLLNFGGCYGVGTGAFDDWDGDGMCNRDEYIAGTSPTNKSSKLEIISLMQDLGNCSISFNTVTGRSYGLLYKSNMTDASWLDLTNNIGGLGSIMDVDDPMADPRRFYRLKVKLP